MTPSHEVRKPIVQCESANCGTDPVSLECRVYYGTGEEFRSSYLCQRCATIALAVAQRHGVRCDILPIPLYSGDKAAGIEARNVLITMLPGDKAAQDIAFAVTRSGF